MTSEKKKNSTIKSEPITNKISKKKSKKVKKQRNLKFKGSFNTFLKKLKEKKYSNPKKIKVAKLKKEKKEKVAKAEKPKVKKVRKIRNFDIAVKLRKKYISIVRKVMGFFQSIGHLIDRNIRSLRSLKVIACVLALLLFYFVNSQPDKQVITGNPEYIKGVEVQAYYNNEFFVVEGLPETADMFLIGSQTDLLRAKNLKNYEVYVDLTDYEPGRHEVELRCRNIATDIEVNLTPAKVTVDIHKKENDSKVVSYDLIRKEKDSKFIVTDVILDESEVMVRGASYKVESIVGVKALIDASKIKGVGELQIEGDVVAYDAKGMPVDVEIFPSTVNATVTVEAPSKDVRIDIVPINFLPVEGVAIKEYKLSYNSVLLYGEQEILDKISSFMIEVDLSKVQVDDARNDYKIVEIIKKPAGINFIDKKEITITLQFTESVSEEFKDIRIEKKNYKSDFNYYGKEDEDIMVDIIVKGAKNIVDEFDKDEDVTVYIDLEGLGVGEHQVDLHIESSDPRLQYELKKEKVTIVIEEK